MALKARPEERQALGLPRLMGADSFNWGAGMHQIGNAAGFIKANMPLGQAGMLSDQEAWDVAYFMNAHERPQDPRYAESVAATRAKYHDSDDSLYGIEVNGHLLGSDSPRPAAVAGGQALNRWRGAAAVSPCRAARFVILAVSASHARHLFMHANSGNVFMVVAPSGAGNPAWSGPCSSKTLPSCSRFPAPRARRVPAKKTVANIASWRSTISSACATIRPCWNGPRCMAISTARPRPHRRRHPRRTRCAARDRLAGRAPGQAALSGRHRHFHPAAVDRGTRSPAQARGQDEPQVIARRLMAAGGEIAHAPECEYVIINQEFSVALSELTQIVSAARLRSSQAARHAPLFAQLGIPAAH